MQNRIPRKTHPDNGSRAEVQEQAHALASDDNVEGTGVSAFVTTRGPSGFMPDVLNSSTSSGLPATASATMLEALREVPPGRSLPVHDSKIETSQDDLGRVGDVLVPPVAKSSTSEEQERELLAQIENVRLDQDFEASLGIETVTTCIPIGRPDPQDWFRVHPTWTFRAAILKLADTGELYVVTKNVAALISDVARPKLVYATVTTLGVFRFWPVRYEGEGRLDPYSQSAHDAAKLATTHWVRLVNDPALRAYKTKRYLDPLQEPAWPAEPLDLLMGKALRGRLLDSPEHPIVRKLLGKN